MAVFPLGLLGASANLVKQPLPLWWNACAVQQADSPGLPSGIKAAVAAWSLVHGFAILSLGGYVEALDEARRPSAHKMVKVPKVRAAPSRKKLYYIVHLSRVLALS